MSVLQVFRMVFGGRWGGNGLGHVSDGSVQLFVLLVLSRSLRGGHCHSTY